MTNNITFTSMRKPFGIVRRNAVHSKFLANTSEALKNVQASNMHGYVSPGAYFGRPLNVMNDYNSNIASYNASRKIIPFFAEKSEQAEELIPAFSFFG